MSRNSMSKRFPKNGLVEIAGEQRRVRDLSLFEMDFLGIALTYEEVLLRLEREEDYACYKLEEAEKALREAQEKHDQSWKRLEYLGRCIKHHHDNNIDLDLWEVSPKVRQKLGEIE